jgi:peptide/nickel transport system substrate-binding protein
MAGIAILSMVGDWLLWQRPDGTLESRIAESWKASNGAKSWTFNIRKGVKFHDGTELTADDVVYSFKAHLDPKNISGQQGNFKNIFNSEGVIKVDKYTVRFDLLEANSNFPYTVSSTSYGAIIIKNGAKGDVAWTDKMISVGPWLLVSYNQQEKTVLKRNPNYWGKNNSTVEFVELIQFASASSSLPQLLTGVIDAVIGLSPASVEKLPKTKFAVQTIPSATSLHVHMRCDWGPFKDKRVRQAAALTLDREGYVKGILRGIGGTVANDSVMDSYPTKDKTVAQRKKDLVKAKRLMKQAGYENGFEVDLSTWYRDDINQLALFIKASFALINIKVNLKIDAAEGGGVFFYTFDPYPSVKGKVFEYDNNSWLASNLGIVDWIGRGVPDQYLLREWRSTGDWNAAHIDSPKLDAAIDAYTKAISFEKKKQATKLIQEASLDQTPYIVVYNANVLFVTNKNVSGLLLNGINQIDGRNIRF